MLGDGLFFTYASWVAYIPGPHWEIPSRRGVRQHIWRYVNYAIGSHMVLRHFQPPLAEEAGHGT